MSAIKPVASSQVTAPAAPAAKAEKTEKLGKAAHEFEAIFVRQILEKSGLGAKGDVYSGLAVGAVAEAVTAGKGLGLGEMIKSAVEKAEAALKNRR